MNICMTTSRTSTNNCVKRVKVYGMKMKKAMVVVKELHHKMTKMILTFSMVKEIPMYSKITKILMSLMTMICEVIKHILNL